MKSQSTVRRMLAIVSHAALIAAAAFFGAVKAAPAELATDDAAQLNPTESRVETSAVYRRRPGMSASEELGQTRELRVERERHRSRARRFESREEEWMPIVGAAASRQTTCYGAGSIGLSALGDSAARWDA